LNRHDKVLGVPFVQPWLFFTTDMTLSVDLTAQVHKARSLPELEIQLEGLKGSVDHGRVEGLRYYFKHARDRYAAESGKTHVVGEMCLGSPEPRPLDPSALYEACPDFRLVHLIRNPVTSYPSFASRHEMDGDPTRIAGSWLTLNAAIRVFFEQRPDLVERYMVVRYEDLLDETESTVRRLCEVLALPFQMEMLQNLERRWGKSTDPTTPKPTAKIIEQIAASEMARYGYLQRA
jgi:hypothetical protein